MRISKAQKWSIAATLSVVSAVAIAKFWGPFNVTLYNPTIQSYADDQLVEFAASMNTPRLALNIGVQQIKRGDIVRMTYASGDVYDMEAALQCSYAGVGCTWAKKTRKDSIFAPPTVSYLEQKDWLAKHGPCEDRPGSQDPSAMRDVTFNTGRWTVEWPDSGNPDVIITHGYWLNTGQVTVRLPSGPSNGCK